MKTSMWTEYLGDTYKSRTDIQAQKKQWHKNIFYSNPETEVQQKTMLKYKISRTNTPL